MHQKCTYEELEPVGDTFLTKNIPLLVPHILFTNFSTHLRFVENWWISSTFPSHWRYLGKCQIICRHPPLFSLNCQDLIGNKLVWSKLPMQRPGYTKFRNQIFYNILLFWKKKNPKMKLSMISESKVNRVENVTPPPRQIEKREKL